MNMKMSRVREMRPMDQLSLTFTASMDTIDSRNDTLRSPKNRHVNLPSDYVLKKHLMLVLSLITSMFTVIGWWMGTTNWLWKIWTSWVVLFASLVTSTLAVLASVDLKIGLLISYSIMGGIELICKIVFIVYIEARLRVINTNCAWKDDQRDCNQDGDQDKFFIESEDASSCCHWRLDDLNLTNSMIFQVFSCICLLTLVIFSIQLIVYISKHPEGQPGHENSENFDGTAATAGVFEDYDQDKEQDNDQENQSQDNNSNLDHISINSDPETYGTFHRRTAYVNQAFLSVPDDPTSTWPRS